jgi:hypothetical protein
MNCQTFRTIVHEIDLPDGLEATALDAALEHAQACGRCARQLYQARALAVALQAVARADQHRQASAETETRLLLAFREGKGPQTARTWRGWMAAAAAIILAAGIGLIWRHTAAAGRRSAARTTASAPAPGAPQASAQLTPALTVSPPYRSAPDHGKDVRAAKANASASSESQNEELADFIPLPYADPDAPLVSGEVVRIRLSEADLGLLGVPVSEDATARSLTADVVIGDDGVARAIRFVPSTMD